MYRSRGYYLQKEIEPDTGNYVLRHLKTEEGPDYPVAVFYGEYLALAELVKDKLNEYLGRN